MLVQVGKQDVGRIVQSHKPNLLICNRRGCMFSFLPTATQAFRADDCADHFAVVLQRNSRRGLTFG